MEDHLDNGSNNPQTLLQRNDNQNHNNPDSTRNNNHNDSSLLINEINATKDNPSPPSVADISVSVSEETHPNHNTVSSKLTESVHVHNVNDSAINNNNKDSDKHTESKAPLLKLQKSKPNKKKKNPTGAAALRKRLFSDPIDRYGNLQNEVINNNSVSGGAGRFDLKRFAASMKNLFQEPRDLGSSNKTETLNEIDETNQLIEELENNNDLADMLGSTIDINPQSILIGNHRAKVENGVAYDFDLNLVIPNNHTEQKQVQNNNNVINRYSISNSRSVNDYSAIINHRVNQTLKPRMSQTIFESEGENESRKDHHLQRNTATASQIPHTHKHTDSMEIINDGTIGRESVDTTSIELTPLTTIDSAHNPDLKNHVHSKLQEIEDISTSRYSDISTVSSAAPLSTTSPLNNIRIMAPPMTLKALSLDRQKSNPFTHHHNIHTGGINNNTDIHHNHNNNHDNDRPRLHPSHDQEVVEHTHKLAHADSKLNPKSYRNLNHASPPSSLAEKLLDTYKPDIYRAHNYNKWIILPTNPFRILWDVATAVFVLYFCFTVPLILTFPVQHIFDTAGWNNFEIFLEVFFWLDMLLQVRTGYIYINNIITNDRAILIHYLQGWFLIDFVSVFPFSYFSSFTAEQQRTIKLIKVIKLTKLLRVEQIILYLGNFFKFRYVVAFVFTVSLFAHWASCLWFYLLTLSDSTLYDAYENSSGSDIWFLYSDVLNDILNQMLGVWEAKYSVSTGQKYFSMFITGIGTVLVAFLFGTIFILLLEARTQREKFRTKMENISNHMIALQVDDDLRNKINAYYNYLWIQKKGSLFGGSLLFEDIDLSEQLKQQVGLHLVNRVFPLKKIRIFEQCSEDCLARIARRLKLNVFMTQDWICKKGEKGTDLFLVQKGIIEVITNPETQNIESAEKTAIQLTAGAVLGEVGLLTEGLRTASVRAVTIVEIAILSKADLLSVFEDYPEYTEQLAVLAIERLENDAKQKLTQRKLIGRSMRSPSEMLTKRKLSQLRVFNNEMTSKLSSLDKYKYSVVGGDSINSFRSSMLRAKQSMFQRQSMHQNNNVTDRILNPSLSGASISNTGSAHLNLPPSNHKSIAMKNQQFMQRGNKNLLATKNNGSTSNANNTSSSSTSVVTNSDEKHADSEQTGTVTILSEIDNKPTGDTKKPKKTNSLNLPTNSKTPGHQQSLSVVPVSLDHYNHNLTGTESTEHKDNHVHFPPDNHNNHHPSQHFHPTVAEIPEEEAESKDDDLDGEITVKQLDTILEADAARELAKAKRRVLSSFVIKNSNTLNRKSLFSKFNVMPSNSKAAQRSILYNSNQSLHLNESQGQHPNHHHNQNLHAHFSDNDNASHSAHNTHEEDGGAEEDEEQEQNKPKTNDNTTEQDNNNTIEEAADEGEEENELE